MGSVLAGRRIVVTRAVEQADELAALLQHHGAVPVVIPLIEIVSTPTEMAQLAEEVGNDFDWLIVTSPNGAHCLIEAAAVLPAATQVAAIGTATADALRAGGFAVAFVPAVQSAVGLLADFPQASRVLLVQAANAEPTLAEGLRLQGAAVTIVAPYRTVAARVTAAQQLAALSADAVLFASGSAARAWADVFGDSTPPVVVAIGPQTAAAATNAGLKVTAVAADHSLPGMLQALERQLLSQS
ncbi:MAG: uroporphyrinogen-III synthase [Actinomycetia bacterium]|nr:uroporphyrinogen-III synthase [Actinomycetes bacterium]